MERDDELPRRLLREVEVVCRKMRAVRRVVHRAARHTPHVVGGLDAVHQTGIRVVPRLFIVICSILLRHILLPVDRRIIRPIRDLAKHGAIPANGDGAEPTVTARSTRQHRVPERSAGLIDEASLVDNHEVRADGMARRLVRGEEIHPCIEVPGGTPGDWGTKKTDSVQARRTAGRRHGIPEFLREIPVRTPRLRANFAGRGARQDGRGGTRR